jgi:hypothetical protein
MGEIEFKDKQPCNYWGHGAGKCVGLSMRKDGPVIEISPVNSRGHIGKVVIQVPVKEIEAIIEELRGLAQRS